MKLTNCLFLSLLLLLLVGCGKKTTFQLEAVSEDIGTQNVTVRYLDLNGAYHIEQIPAVDGKINYVGNIDGSTYIEIFDLSNRLLGEFIADGGDHIKARFSVTNPANITVEGNDDAVLLKEWLDQNRGSVMKGDVEAVNSAVAAFVRENPKQFASTALLLKYFTTREHEQQALELLQSISAKQRPASKVLWFEQALNLAMGGNETVIPDLHVFAHSIPDTSIRDSAFTFTPHGARMNLLLLTDNDSRSADSIRTLIASLPHTRTDLRVVDLGCDRDTLLWGVSIRNLPSDYPEDVLRFWLPAGPATPGIAEVAPAAIPTFILTDSIGHVVCRTTSVRNMQQFLIHKH